VPELPAGALGLLLLFFLLGFFLYGALYAAVGAAVNSQQEAQSLVFPVMLPLVAGVVMFPLVLMRPDGLAARAVSLVPFWTPLLMALRVTTLMPPAWEVALSVAVTSATIAGLTWAAGRIFRVGVLMYGKRPTCPEILKWVARG
jgi:ABC-2 type transport system permease protein